MITTHNPDLAPGQTFTTNGRQVLDPHLAEAVVTEELGGPYTLTLSWPHNPAVALEVGDIVAAPVPDGTRQGFRVATLTMDGEQTWHATCHHSCRGRRGAVRCARWWCGKAKTSPAWTKPPTPPA